MLLSHDRHVWDVALAQLPRALGLFFRFAPDEDKLLQGVPSSSVEALQGRAAPVLLLARNVAGRAALPQPRMGSPSRASRCAPIPR